jgi:hypothetical protein
MKNPLEEDKLAFRALSSEMMPFDNEKEYKIIGRIKRTIGKNFFIFTGLPYVIVLVL